MSDKNNSLSNEEKFANYLLDLAKKKIKISTSDMKREIEVRGLDKDRLFLKLIEMGLLPPQRMDEEDYIKYLFS